MDGKELAQRTWGSSPTGWTSAPEFEPGTKQFFDKALQLRRTHEMPWLPEVVPFASSRGRSVVEIGFGPGYDAFAFMEAGADYSGIDITPENVDRTIKHLAFYGHTPDVRQGDAENLPYGAMTFDIAFSNGVLHHVPDIERAIAEIYRVLKPGGEAFIILYNKNSLFYRLTLTVWQHYIKDWRRREPLETKLRRIEANQAGELPLVRVYTRAQSEALLRAAGFESVSSAVRKLVWEDFPISTGPLGAVLRAVPERWLHRLGHWCGWYVIVQGRKPKVGDAN